MNEVITLADILDKVKIGLNITGTYQDETLRLYIDEVKLFLKDSGISDYLINSNYAVGVIIRGVSDLWNYGLGSTKFSDYFFQRVLQLKLHDIEVKPYKEINFVKDYLYEIEYSMLDYDFAYKFFKEHSPIIIGGCSSIRNNNLYGRNFDWKYNNDNEYIVKIKNVNGYHSSIGVAHEIDGINKDDLFKILPFLMTDGINDCGVIANINVVPIDKGVTSGTNPVISNIIEICSLMLVRFILDHFSSADTCVNYIKNYMSIFNSKKMLNNGYDVHLMVADKAETYLIEFIDNVTTITKMNKPYMTNFFLSDIILNSNNKVYTPDSIGHSPIENNVSQNGSGLERYNLIVENYENCNIKRGMRELLNKLKYSNTYDKNNIPLWFTEFVGVNNLTVDSKANEFTETINEAVEQFKKRIRNGKTWHTLHSVIYDIENCTMSLITQEDGEELNYEL